MNRRMTWRHVGESYRLSRRVGGRIGRLLERSAEASALEAAAAALELANEALDVAAQGRMGAAMTLLNRAGIEAGQAIEVGWPWVLDEPRDKGGAA